MKFKEWLKEQLKIEVSTSTGDVANFSMPIMTMVKTRQYPDPIVKANSANKKSKCKKKPKDN